MKGLKGVRRFFHLGAFRPDPEEDLASELSFHFQETLEELRARGLSPAAAREEARRRFGDLTRYRKDLARIDRGVAARSKRVAVLEALGQDLRYLFRGMTRSPGFTVAVVLTLALGIGANATMFGIIDRLLLSPPSGVADPESVVRLQIDRVSPFTGDRGIWSYLAFQDYQDFLEAGGLEAVGAYGTENVILGRGEEAERVNALFGTASFLRVLGVQPVLGRFFEEAEAQAGTSRVVVLSYGLWQRRYGGTRDVLGRSLSVGDGSFTVVGVAPRGFNGVDLERVDLILPIHAYTAHTGSDRWVGSRGYYWLQAVARLPASASRVAVAEEATALHRNGRQDLIDRGFYPEDTKVVLGPLPAALGPDAPGEVAVSRWLAGVTLIVLLIACANVANLLLARGAGRQREVGIRIALGISRRRLVGQLLSESVTLAGIGGGVGLVMAYWGGGLLQRVFLPDVPWSDSAANPRVLLFTLVLAVATGLLAGTAPAWTGTRGGVVGAMKEGGWGGSGRRSRSQAFLLVTQAALSLILLVGAGLFVRSLQQAQELNMGFNPEGLVVARLTLEGEWEPEARLDLAQRAIARMKTLPGVVEAGAANPGPFAGMWALDFFVPGVDSIPAPPLMGPFITGVTPGYLPTLGSRLLEGRLFTEQEASSGTRVAVVTRNMARGLWPSESALGKCFKVNEPENPCWEVVGVVEDSYLSEIRAGMPWQYYLPFGPPALELGMDPGVFMIRTQGDPSALIFPLRDLLRGLDPGVRFAHVQPLQSLIDPQLRSWRLGATMFSLFGILALLVASVGLYSVLAFSVARRTRELGVRHAVGASSGQIMGLVVREALSTTGVGVVVGLALAVMAGGELGPLLFNTSPRDPVVIGGVVGALLLVAVVAGALPARSASRVDPIQALRSD
jgi:predicted permease